MLRSKKVCKKNDRFFYTLNLWYFNDTEFCVFLQ